MQGKQHISTRRTRRAAKGGAGNQAHFSSLESPLCVGRRGCFVSPPREGCAGVRTPSGPGHPHSSTRDTKHASEMARSGPARPLGTQKPQETKASLALNWLCQRKDCSQQPCKAVSELSQHYSWLIYFSLFHFAKSPQIPRINRRMQCGER